MRPFLVGLVLLCLAGCYRAATPASKPTAPKTAYWGVVADRLDAGHWDYSQRLVKNVSAVAKAEKVPFPADYDTFLKPYIAKNQKLDDATRKKLAAKFRAWKT